jgi:hypothetical protein
VAGVRLQIRLTASIPLKETELQSAGRITSITVIQMYSEKAGEMCERRDMNKGKGE